MIISQAIGDYGRWQFVLTLLLAFCNIPSTFHIFVPTFHARALDTWCARPANFTEVDPIQWRQKTQKPDDYCRVIREQDLNLQDGELHVAVDAKYEDCQTWEFDGEGSTLITEYGLLCAKANLISIAEMVFLGGVALGGLVSGVISDRYGRKKTLIGSVALQTLLGVIIAFNPWFEMYLFLRAILGFVSVSVVFSGFVLSIELVGGVWRTVAGISYLFPTSISFGLISAIAYFIRDWRTLQLVISLPGALILSYWWFVPESPRWLLAMGRTAEVLKILETAARFNKRKLPANIDKQLLPTSNSINNETMGVMDLFKTPKLRKITLCLFVIWFSVYFIYYGITLNLGNIGGDLYLASALSGLVEVPALAISIVILLKMGRRWPLAVTVFFAGCFCLMIIPVPYVLSNAQWLITSFAMSGKFLIAASNSIMPVFTAELYPTKIRNIGVGANNVPAGVALMLVPYLWDLATFHDSVPMAILGISGLIGGSIVLLLPETGDSQLQESIENSSDEELFKKTNKILVETRSNNGSTSTMSAHSQ